MRDFERVLVEYGKLLDDFMEIKGSKEIVFVLVFVRLELKMGKWVV